MQIVKSFYKLHKIRLCRYATAQLHAPLTKNIIVMKPESAQMAKYAGNVYLAMRITFANQMADLCEMHWDYSLPQAE